MSSSSNVSSSAQRTTGRVKWFNGKAGYGFITATTGEQVGTDVFVHHSSLVVASQQYRYLVQGEYVEFQINALEGSGHRFQATDVSGIGRGMLMCETRRQSRDVQLSTEFDSQNNAVSDEAMVMKRSRQTMNRDFGPREVVDLTTPSVDVQPAPKRSRNSKKAAGAGAATK
jgi:cold shock CspA family protein